MRIDARIDEKYGELSPQEQRIADFILDHLGDLAVYSAAELSRLSGVSKATVSRLFRRLGFADFQEVKQHTRALRNEGVPLSASESAAQGLEGHLQHETDNLRRSLSQLSDGRLETAISTLAKAKCILILGMRNSYPIALHLRQQLLQARGSVSVGPQPGQTIGEELAGIGAGDAVVLVGFRRRPEVFGRLVEAVSASGADSILLADSTARKFAGSVSCWLECPVDSVGAFDSYATAASIAGLLANGVLAAHPQQGRKRISAIATNYERLEELESV